LVLPLGAVSWVIGFNTVTMWHNVAQMSSVNFVNYFGRLGVAFLSPFCVVAFSVPKCAEQDSGWPLSESADFFMGFFIFIFLFLYKYIFYYNNIILIYIISYKYLLF